MTSNEPENAYSVFSDRLWSGRLGTEFFLAYQQPGNPLDFRAVAYHFLKLQSYQDFAGGKPGNHKELENNLRSPNKQARPIYIQTPRIPFRFSESYSSYIESSENSFVCE